MVFTVVNDGADIRETTSLPVPEPERRHQSTVATLVSFGCWLALIAVAVVWGRHLLDRGVPLAIGAAPLSGRFGWRVSADALVPVVFAAAVVAVAPLIAARVAWARVVLVGCALSVLWAVALSRIDGNRALFSPFFSPAYLQTAQTIRDPHLFLSQFVQRIHSYNSHTRGHPPGMELFLWATARLGLTGVGWTTFLALAGGAAAGAAALIALRDLTDEARARVAMPFVVLAPAAIWWSSGDAFFAGIAAWAVCLVVLATGREGRRSDRLAVLGGLLFGVTAFLSYGLVLLALIPLVVAVSRRRLRPLVLAALGVVPVFIAFRAAGFSWPAGLAATRTQYWLGAARGRPYNYFLFGDLAAFALATGPAAAVAIGRLRDRRTWLLVGGALAAIALADLSGMSKAEVERIWLPFVPWVLLATSTFAATRHRRERSVLARPPSGERGTHRVGGTVPVVTDAPRASPAPVSAARVLVVEDDATVREVVERYLEREGIVVDAVADGLVALEHAASCWPDLVVLDLMLPGIDGLEVCRRLRARAPVPVIMLTARGDEDDRVIGLELGADDYIAKPFSPRELTLRVQAVLRRAAGSLQTGDDRARIVVGDLDIDVPSREVFRSGARLALTAREFDLLVHFAAHPRQVLRREELLEEVWGFSYGDTATVTVHVRRLREKIEGNPAAPRHLTTVWGVGYRWDP